MNKLLEKARVLEVPDGYEISVEHASTIMEEGMKGEYFDAIMLAFNLGFLRGTNATKAKYRKKRGK